MKYEAKLPEKNVNVSPTPPWLDFLWLTGGFSLALFALWVFLGFAVDWVAPHVPREMERAIADALPLPAMEGEGSRDPFLGDLAQALAAAAPEEPGPVTVGERPMGAENAFAFPGGRILFSSELLDAAESENEVAFVLAHEMGHVAHRDALRSLGRGLLLALAGSLFMNADASVETFLGSTLKLGALQYSREQEEAADLYALQTVGARYGHVGGALDLFARLAEREKKGVALPEFLSTHPGSGNRVERLEAEARGLGYETGQTTPLPADWGERRSLRGDEPPGEPL